MADGYAQVMLWNVAILNYKEFLEVAKEVACCSTYKIFKMIRKGPSIKYMTRNFTVLPTWQLLKNSFCIFTG